MAINLIKICILLTTILLSNDAFNTRVKRYEKVTFKSIPKASTAEFDFLGTSYLIDLKPNHAAYHHEFSVTTSQGIDKTSRHEYIGIVKNPYPGKAILTEIDDNEYIGVIHFHNDTLHLEPCFVHDMEDDLGNVVGYFGSDVNSTLDLYHVPVQYQVSYPPPNPFLAIRRKREAEQRQEPARRADIQNEKRNRCPVKIVADYSFYSIFGKKNIGIVTRFLVNMMARVNEIYTRVNWDEGKEDMIQGRGRFESMGFSIKEIKVLDRPNGSDIHYNSYSKIWKSDKLLQDFAEREGSPDFCLVHLVTARTFLEQATLGLAFVGDKKWDENPGGICSKKENFHGRPAYLNVLLSTVLMNNGEQNGYPLITKEIDIVVAHEYGHTWGALHDPTFGSNDTDVEICAASSDNGGNFIMNPYAQNGYDPNNVLFSPCSKKRIRDVLNNKFTSCFEQEKTSFCGNGIVEEDEECDNGVETEDVRCCDKFCRFVMHAKCSPLNHPCCNEACQFHNSSHICLPGDKLLCKADAICTGTSGECPHAPSVEDGISCIEDGECSNGVCLPFCEKKSIGKKSCICDKLDFACHRCCRDSNGVCAPEPNAENLRDGTRCTRGYCRQNKCVNEAVDQVRAYFLAPFQSPEGLFDHIKSNLVMLVLFIVTIIYALVVLCVKNQDQAIAAEKEAQPNCRKVHVRHFNNNSIQAYL